MPRVFFEGDLAMRSSWLAASVTLSLSLSPEIAAQDGGRFLPPFNHHNWKDTQGGATGTQPYRYSVDATQWARARNDPAPDPQGNAWVRAMHLSLIATPGTIPGQSLQGRVLLWDGNEGQDPDGYQFWSIMNPDVDVPLDDHDKFWNFELAGLTSNGRNADFGCAGHSFTAAGDLIVGGGTARVFNPNPPPTHAILGAFFAYRFEPNQDPGFGTPFGSNMWVRFDDMQLDRWYPSITMFWGGPGIERMLVTDGRNDDTYEALDPRAVPAPQWVTWGTTPNRLFSGPEASTGLEELLLYPRLHQLSNGDIFRSGMTDDGCVTYHQDGPNAGPGTWSARDTTSSATVVIRGATVPVTTRNYGASLVFPNIDGRHTDAVMTLGGEEPDPGAGPLDPTAVPHASAEICKPTATAAGPFDPPAGQPQGYDWTSLPAMNHARVNPNAVILPDASILVLGGGDMYIVTQGSKLLNPVKWAERFKGGAWQQLVESTSFRSYHSTALLLPDGRVLLAGGDDRSWDYEIYEPPYLTTGLPRPSFVTNPETSLTYNTAYTLQFSIAAGATVSKVVLMRPGSTTHHSDFDQRYVELPVTVITGVPPTEGRFVQLTTPIGPPTPPDPMNPRPANARFAAPGWWMMFLVSDNGVPSEAKWVRFNG
jgi:hypothetical protein